MKAKKLFEFLKYQGGDLFESPDGKWRYTTDERDCEGQVHLVHGLGDTPQEALKSHPAYRCWVASRRGR